MKERGSRAECFGDGGPLSRHLGDVSLVPSFSASSGSRSSGGTLRLPDEVRPLPVPDMFFDSLCRLLEVGIGVLVADWGSE